MRLAEERCRNHDLTELVRTLDIEHFAQLAAVDLPSPSTFDRVARCARFELDLGFAGTTEKINDIGPAHSEERTALQVKAEHVPFSVADSFLELEGEGPLKLVKWEYRQDVTVSSPTRSFSCSVNGLPGHVTDPLRGRLKVGMQAGGKVQLTLDLDPGDIVTPVDAGCNNVPWGPVLTPGLLGLPVRVTEDAGKPLRHHLSGVRPTLWPRRAAPEPPGRVRAVHRRRDARSRPAARATSLGTAADPLLAALVDLLLPERDRLLERVDRLGAGGERGQARWAAETAITTRDARRCRRARRGGGSRPRRGRASPAGSRASSAITFSAMPPLRLVVEIVNGAAARVDARRADEARDRAPALAGTVTSSDRRGRSRAAPRRAGTRHRRAGGIQRDLVAVGELTVASRRTPG